jgi:hypothetical protein
MLLVLTGTSIVCQVSYFMTVFTHLPCLAPHPHPNPRSHSSTSSNSTLSTTSSYGFAGETRPARPTLNHYASQSSIHSRPNVAETGSLRGRPSKSSLAASSYTGSRKLSHPRTCVRDTIDLVYSLYSHSDAGTSLTELMDAVGREHIPSFIRSSFSLGPSGPSRSSVSSYSDAGTSLTEMMNAISTGNEHTPSARSSFSSRSSISLYSSHSDAGTSLTDLLVAVEDDYTQALNDELEWADGGKTPTATMIDEHSFSRLQESPRIRPLHIRRSFEDEDTTSLAMKRMAVAQRRQGIQDVTAIAWAMAMTPGV